MKKLVSQYQDFRDRVLVVYIVLSVVFCAFYVSVFLAVGEFLPACLQGAGLLAMGLALYFSYIGKISPARLLSISTSYLLVFGQSFLFFGGNSGFPFLYIALLVVAFTAIRYDNRRAKRNLTAFSVLLLVTFLFLQKYSLMLAGTDTPHFMKRVMFDSSIVGIFVGIYIVLYSFSRELERKNLNLQYLATVDQLTGMNNRRNFMSYLDSIFKTVKEHHGVFSLLMVDVDRFKTINDQYGHIAGDIALKEVAAVIRQSVRESDYCARYGGEEFSVILPNTGENSALVVADKIRSNVEKHFFDIGTEIKLQITVSIGISTYNPKSPTTDVLLKKADIALYRSKENGRNRCNAYFEAL